MILFYVLQMLLAYIPTTRSTNQLDLRQEKYVTISTLVELAEVVLNNNIFTFKEKTLKQKQDAAIGTKLAPPCSISNSAEIEEEILSEIELRPYMW